MSEKSLFFNALPNAAMPTGYDRNYNADDISDWLAVVWENGVVKDGLKVNASSGLTVNVEAGRAALKGKAYVNDAVKHFTLATAPTGTSPRYDYIKIKLDNTVNVRAITLELVQGTSTPPTISDLTRNTNIYELMLAIITVNPNATTITQTDISDKRGDADLCPWFTAVKGYEDYYDAIIQRYRDYVDVELLTNSVTTEIASNLYNAATDLASVYINGMLINAEDYTLTNVSGFIVITFEYNIQAGQIVGIEIDRAFDGEGLPNVYEDYLNLKQMVENLSGSNDYVYTCNGLNDNVLLSQIAQTYLSGGTDRGNKTIRVYGTFGMTAPNNGDGTIGSNYTVFNFGLNTTTNRRITFDFSDCTEVSQATVEGSYYTMFGGANVSIVGGSFILNGMGISKMFSAASGTIKATDSRFIIIGKGASYIAPTGTFINCYSDVTNLNAMAYAYYVSPNGLIRLIGGEHYAYGISGQNNGVVYLGTGLSAAVLDGANFPTVSRGGFIQTNYLYAAAGAGIVTGFVVTQLTASVTVSTSNRIFAVIPFSKPNLG